MQILDSVILIDNNWTVDGGYKGGCSFYNSLVALLAVARFQSH